MMVISTKNLEKTVKGGGTTTWILREQGLTIVQVTHSEENAGYGNRVILLKDGWVVDRL